MIGPKAENTVEGGDHNTQVGHNSGTITFGPTFEEHREAVKEALAEKTADLERAHGAEKELLNREIAELSSKLENIRADYEERLKELTETKAKLARFENQIEKAKLDAAYAALNRDDTTLAQALFKELAEQARLRREDAAEEEASFEFELGKLAEQEVRWADAATHYARAADLSPTYDHLNKARRYHGLSGNLSEALRYGRALVDLARSESSETDLATALNNHALNLMDAGRYGEAEPLFREALEIGRNTIGEDHPDYATSLNNLASLLQDTGRYEEAEPLYREALEIRRNALGEAHPDHAQSLNNLAGLLRVTGRYEEAEPLYREALEIVRKALGEAHPDYAQSLNNLAGLLHDTGRYEEAEPLFREALEITRNALGEAHPDYARSLNNLAGLLRATGRYDEAEPLFREALEIGRKTIGEEHPIYATRLNNLALLLHDTERHDEAEPLFREAVSVFETALGADHPNTKKVRGNLERLLAERP